MRPEHTQSKPGCHSLASLVAKRQSRPARPLNVNTRGVVKAWPGGYQRCVTRRSRAVASTEVDGRELSVLNPETKMLDGHKNALRLFVIYLFGFCLPLVL